MVTITPVDDNNKDIFSIESLLGPTLLKDVKGPSVPTAKDALKSNNKSGIIALYFSASWCPPCKRFTPILTDFYNAAKKAKCGFEIIFVSSDQGTKEFEEYYGKMPWLSIPPIEGSAKIKTNLAETMGVCGIPALAIIDTKTGEFIIGGEARDDVVAAGGDTEKVVSTIAKWAEAQRHPLSEAPKMMDMGKGSKNHFFRFLSFLAKNPMIIFGLLYFYKWMQRKMIEAGFDDANSSTPPGIEDSPMGDEDTEF